MNMTCECHIILSEILFCENYPNNLKLSKHAYNVNTVLFDSGYTMVLRI